MTQLSEPLPPHLVEPSRNGGEISITGKWVPTKQGGIFRKSAESKEMLSEWEDIHGGARADHCVLSTEKLHASGLAMPSLDEALPRLVKAYGRRLAESPS